MHTPRPTTISAVRAGVCALWRDGRIPGPVGYRELAARSGLADRTVQGALDAGVLESIGIARTAPGGKPVNRLSEAFTWTVTDAGLFRSLISERQTDPSGDYWQDAGQTVRAAWSAIQDGRTSTVAVAAQVGVSRRTADRALGRLESDGAVSRGEKRGTWVANAVWTPSGIRVGHVDGTVLAPDGGRKRVTGTRKAVRQSVRAGARAARDRNVERFAEARHVPSDEQVARLSAAWVLGATWAEAVGSDETAV